MRFMAGEGNFDGIAMIVRADSVNTLKGVRRQLQ